MTIYILLFALILFFALIQLCYKGNIKNRNIVLTGLCIVLCLVAGLRGMGYDYDNYIEIYDAVHSGLDVPGIDRGFRFLCVVMPNFRLLLLFMAIMTFLPLHWVLKEKSDYAFMSLLIFFTTLFLPMVMGQMRQGVAVFMMLYAYYRWKGTKVFWLLLVMCTVMHASALIAVLFLLPVKRLYPIYVYIILVGCAFVFGRILAPVFLPFMNSIGIMEDTNIIYRINIYSATETAAGLSLGFNTAVLFRCFIFILGYIVLRMQKDGDASTLNLFFFSIIIYWGFAFLPQLGGRGSLYFSVLEMILIPSILRAYQGRMRTILIAVFIILFGLRLNHFFSDDHNSASYVPYKIEMGSGGAL